MANFLPRRPLGPHSGAGAGPYFFNANNASGRGAFAQGASMTFKMKAFTDVFIDKDLSAADKIVLHDSILQEIEGRFRGNRPHLIFRIRNLGPSKAGGGGAANNATVDLTGASTPAAAANSVTNNKRHMRNIFEKSISHCGVLEFSAPNRNAYLPVWMMDNLGLDNGYDVELKLVDLPPARKVVFKPLQQKFYKLPTPKQTLEYTLSKFTALTVGDRTMIKVGQNMYDLNVVEVDPARGQIPHGVRVFDCSVQVEFLEANEQEAADTKVQDIAVGGGAAVTGSVPADSFRYYRLKLPDPRIGLSLQLRAMKGDPDLYISTTTLRPSIGDHTWHVASKGGSASYRISSRDKNFSGTWYYIAVHAYKETAEFELICSQSAASDAAAGGPMSQDSTGLPMSPPNSRTTSEMTASGMKKSGGQTTGITLTPANATDKKCDNCHRYIPERQYQMHSLRCARNNWRCDICGDVFKVAERDAHAHCKECNKIVHPDIMQKHIDTVHSAVVCACGVKLEPALLKIHQADMCPLRVVSCKFCKRGIPFSDKSDHESYCGSKSQPCSWCNVNVPMWKMQIHLATVHGVNPSVTPSGGGASAAATVGQAATAAMGAADASDKALQDAIRRSMEDLPMGDAPGSNVDMALQRALMASAAAAGAREQPIDLTNVASSGAAAVRRASVEGPEHDADEPFLEPEEMQGDELGWGDDGDDDDDVAADDGHGRSILEQACPYCMMSVPNYDALVEHLKTCDKVTA